VRKGAPFYGEGVKLRRSVRWTVLGVTVALVGGAVAVGVLT